MFVYLFSDIGILSYDAWGVFYVDIWYYLFGYVSYSLDAIHLSGSQASIVSVSSRVEGASAFNLV